MSTTLETNPTAALSSGTTAAQTAASQLRLRFSAMKLSFSWLGNRKSLNSDQKQQAAQPFGAEQNFISAAKKLIDTGHPAVRAVNQVRQQAIATWKNSSLPFPEPGIRLVRQPDISELDDQMRRFHQQLEASVSELNSCYSEIKHQARERLGSLYSALDYPSELTDAFKMSWEFPNVEPPDYLRQLKPEIYEQECQRVRGRFQQAVELAEQAFIDELAALVSHLAERLAGAEDGRPKIFRDSALENLQDFFERFQRLNLSSNEEIDDLVQRAQSIVQGVQPQTLRENDSLRQTIGRQLSGVQSVIDGLMVDRPRRRILRD